MKDLEILGPKAHHKNKRVGVAYKKTKKRYSNSFIGANATSALLLFSAVCCADIPGISAICVSLAFIFTFCSLMLPDHEKYTIKEYYTTHKSERRKTKRLDLAGRLSLSLMLILFIYGNIFVITDNTEVFNYDTFMNGFITSIILSTVGAAALCTFKIMKKALIFT